MIRVKPTQQEEQIAGDVPQDSKARIEFFTEDKNTGLGRKYKAVTEESIERWDQASDNSNWVAIDFIVYDHDGQKDPIADVNVTATDETQNRQLGGKQEYQYLFKTKGLHMLTFESPYGVIETVTLQAN